MKEQKKNEPAWVVYMLKCRNGSLYTGITNNLERRLEEHKNGVGSKYVRSWRPFKCVHVEEVSSISEALKREYQIKAMTPRNKRLLVKEGKIINQGSSV